MFSLILISLTLLSLVFYTSSRSSSIKRNGKPLPRPPNTLPFVGNGILFLQDRHKLFSWFTKCVEKFGLETFEISVPSLPPGIVINDPKNLEFVFKNEGIFEKGDFFKKRSWDLFGNGIINSDGNAWKVQRKAGLHFMSSSNLRVLTDTVLPKYCEEMMVSLDGAAERGEVVDLEVVLLELTTKLMGKMAYDMEMHASDSFSQAFEYASGKTGERFQNPLWQITDFFFGQKFRESIATVKKFGREIVGTAVQSRKAQATVREYMEMNGISGQELDDSEDDDAEKNVVEGSLINSLLDSIDDHQMVADAALNYLSAGRDTTAQSLTWTFYLLIRNPAALSRLQHEIKHLESNKTDMKNTARFHATSLPYTMATIYESLRLYPPVPFELKQCTSPTGTTLPDGTHLPFGSVIVWCPWAMNRSPLLWPSLHTSIHTWDDKNENKNNNNLATSTPTPKTTTTPYDFEPSRWLKISENSPSTSTSTNKNTHLLTRPAHEFPVFNGGSRTCLGKKMAEAVMCQVVACLVDRYVFRMREEGKEKVSRNSLTLPMEGGLEVWVVRR